MLDNFLKGLWLSFCVGAGVAAALFLVVNTDLVNAVNQVSMCVRGL